MQEEIAITLKSGAYRVSVMSQILSVFTPFEKKPPKKLSRGDDGDPVIIVCQQEKYPQETEISLSKVWADHNRCAKKLIERDGISLSKEIVRQIMFDTRRFSQRSDRRTVRKKPLNEFLLT